MKAIWKFAVPWPPDREDFALAMPEGAHVLSVQAQHGRPTVWAIVETTAPNEQRPFRVLGTGFECPDDDARHIGTCLLNDGLLVMHFFDLHHR